MSKVKTRETHRSVKTLDKAVAAGDQMKRALIHTKDTAARLNDDGHRTPNEYAEDKAQYGAEAITHDAAHIALDQGRKLAHKGRDALHERREAAKQAEPEPPKEPEPPPPPRPENEPEPYTPRPKSYRSAPQEHTQHGESGLQPVATKTTDNEVPAIREKSTHSLRTKGDTGAVVEHERPMSYEATREQGRRYAQQAARHHAADSRARPKTIAHSIGRPKEEPEVVDLPSPVERGRQFVHDRARIRQKQAQHVKGRSEPTVRTIDGIKPIAHEIEASESRAVEQGRALAEKHYFEAWRVKRQKQSLSEVGRSELENGFKRSQQAERTIRRSARSAEKRAVKTANGTVKNSAKAVKTAEQTSKAAVKTAQASAKAAQKSAQAAAKTARASAQAARATAKAAAATAKTIAKAVVTAVKAIGAAVKELVAAIAAGGWVAVIVIVVICLIGLIVASPFGIFFAGNNRDNGAVSVSAAVSQVNYDFNSQLETLQSGDYDDIDITGAMADCPEVLAVFAVKVAGSEDVDAMDVATLDATRMAKLKEVFWDMNTITSTVETIDHPDSDPDDDVDDSWTERILHLTISAKTAKDMKTEYGFSEKQKASLDELLQNRDVLLELIGDLSFISTDAEAVIRNLPDGLSDERREVVKTACSLVGKINYFWGGKSLVIGWDTRWGTVQKVWADGSETTGTYRPYGLDCSGFVDWVFYNMTDGAYVIGHGGGASSQHSYCRSIEWSEAIPGDLVFYPEDSHVGIVGGWDEDGNLLIVHCASGTNGTVITGVTGFTSIGRPVYYGE